MTSFKKRFPICFGYRKEPISSNFLCIHKQTKVYKANENSSKLQSSCLCELKATLKGFVEKHHLPLIHTYLNMYVINEMIHKSSISQYLEQIHNMFLFLVYNMFRLSLFYAIVN